MGQTLSQEIERQENDKKFEDVARLRKREGEMRQKYEEKKAKLYIEALNDECLPIICAVDTFSDFLFNVKKPTAPSQDRFGIGNVMKKHLYGDYLKEFVTLLEGVVEKVLAEGTPEVVEEELLHVVFANMSVLRIDFFLYRHNFGKMNTLLYFVQVGVIDMKRVRLPVLQYELTRATRNRDDLGRAGEELKDMAESSTKLQAALQILASASKGNTTGVRPEDVTPSTARETARQQMSPDGGRRAPPTTQ